MTRKLVNHAGLLALKSVAENEPSLFATPNPDRLKRRMEEVAETDEIWGGELSLQADLSPLERIERGGPRTDAMYARLLQDALPNLPPSEGLNEYRWATINCFVVPRYVPIRWDTSNMANDPKKLSNFVQLHWLKGNLTDARRANAAARLWWLGELSSRAAKETSVLDRDEILEAMANNVQFYHQLLSRPNLLSRPRLVAAVYEMFLDGDNDYLNSTNYANPLFSALNLRAADVSLDLMDRNELRDAVEEAKPPKGL